MALLASAQVVRPNRLSQRPEAHTKKAPKQQLRGLLFISMRRPAPDRAGTTPLQMLGDLRADLWQCDLKVQMKITRVVL